MFGVESKVLLPRRGHREVRRRNPGNSCCFDLTKVPADSGGVRPLFTSHGAGHDAGRPVGVPACRPRGVDGFLDKIEDWVVETSRGQVRAYIAHEKLLALGFAGSAGRPGVQSLR